MKSSMTKMVLEHLVECGGAMAIAFLSSAGSTSLLARNMARVDRSLQNCPHFVPSKHKSALSSILSRLRREGLIAREGSRRYARWHITVRGRAHIENQRGGDLDATLPPKDGKIRLVTFDIPERERRKRDWLRRELIACDFQLLHKSVWVGERPLTEELVTALGERRLDSYVHIISFEPSGTITGVEKD